MAENDNYGPNEKSIQTPYQQYRYERFSQLFLSFLSILHWLEYGYLFYGTFCFLYTKKQKGFRYQLKPLLMSDDSEMKWFKMENPCACKKKFLKTKLEPIIITCALVFFLGVSITPPISNMINLWQKLAKNENAPLHTLLSTSYTTS